MVTLPVKFCRELAKVVPEIEKGIEEKGSISITPKDLVEKMGGTFRYPEIVYWKAKECLFVNGISVEHEKKDHEDILLMRARKPEDKLPESMERSIRSMLGKEKGERI